jgi:hypothetical protein
VSTTPCRCGYTGDGPHPCHADGYACGKPAQARYYDPNPGQWSLAGMQLKLSVTETWACDGCWDAFKKQMEKSA